MFFTFTQFCEHISNIWNYKFDMILLVYIDNGVPMPKQVYCMGF